MTAVAAATPWIDHGSFSTRWTPENGGTAEFEQEQPNSALVLGGLGLGAAAYIGGTRLAARSAPGNRIMLGASILAAGSLLGGAALAQAFGGTKTGTQLMTRAKYDESIRDVRHQTGFFGSAVSLVGAQAIGATAAYGASKLLANAPKPLALAGVLAAYGAGVFGGFRAVGAGVDALGL